MSNAPVKSALPNEDFFMRISVLSPDASNIVTISGFGGLPVIFIDLIAFAISGFFGVSTISLPEFFDTLKRLSGTFSPESTPFNPAIISDTARELGISTRFHLPLSNSNAAESAPSKIIAETNGASVCHLTLPEASEASRHFPSIGSSKKLTYFFVSKSRAQAPPSANAAAHAKNRPNNKKNLFIRLYKQ